MKNSNRWLVLLLVAAVAPALAQQRNTIAAVGSLKGDVLVNKGAQFVPATDGDSLAPGDRVLVPRDGGGEIVFRDGCKLQVKPGTMVTVPEASTCVGAVAVVQNTEPAGAGALGVSSGGSDALGYTAFVVAAATAGYVVIHNGTDNSKKPISP